jgi:hypothetical protein
VLVVNIHSFPWLSVAFFREYTCLRQPLPSSSTIMPFMTSLASSYGPLIQTLNNCKCFASPRIDKPTTSHVPVRFLPCRPHPRMVESFGRRHASVLIYYKETCDEIFSVVTVSG